MPTLDRLSNQAIEALPVPAKGQEFYWYGDPKGFAIRVTANGAKSFIVQGRVNGKTCRYTIGPCDRLHYKEAQKRARDRLSEMYDGVNPQVERKRRQAQELTLRQVMQDYIENKRTKHGPLRPSSKSDIEKCVTKQFGDWADKAVANITREACVKRFRELSATAPITANQGGSTGAVPIAAPAAPQPPVPTIVGAWPAGALRCPPGWAGVIAQYIYDQAPRPQAEAAIVAALGLLAGICGRQWSISNTGLNIYLVLVARSATGKEAIHSGVGRLCAFVGAKNNDVAQFVSANEYASAQALKKELGTRLGFVNLRGEIGHWFAEISRGKNDVVTGLKRELTNLYMKSSRGTLAGGLAYSNRDKNVEIDTNVAYSLIGDTTPGTFYSSLDARMMEDGFISRFTVVEYTGDRPDENPTPSIEPPEALVAYLAGLVFTATEYLKRDQYALVSRDADASLLLQSFADECDTHIREAGADEFRRQMWNRAHLKALRISALLAVADNYVHPCINREQAEWAIDLIRRDISVFDRRLRSGDIGDESDTNRHEKLLDICRDYLTLAPEEVSLLTSTQN